MKKIFCLLMLVIFSTLMLHAQSVAINTDGSTPNASAMVDIKSTNKGMLIPRMTSAQRTAISSPASGLLVFDNSTESFWFYTTSGWIELVSGSSQWTLNSGNITNNNSGSVTVGAGVSNSKFNVNSSSGSSIASFNGYSNTSYISFYENGAYRGYLGSYAGAVNDIDFGTGGGNGTGKIHFTLQGNPSVTIDNTGNLGIGTTTPTEKLVLNDGNILLANSSLGIRLNAAIKPMITRAFDPFTSGPYSGIGRWGLFLESNRLILGIPSGLTGKAFEFAAWHVDAGRTPLVTIDQSGRMNRPATNSADLLPIAYGTVDYTGNILSGSGNFTIYKAGMGSYQLKITGEPTYSTLFYTTIVTISQNFGFASVINVGTPGTNGVLVVTSNSSGSVIDSDFSFIVYRQ